ncbi:DUF559 domain-containing protein [Saccharomonospora piscinae]|uniref:DUF559 domain-containing protein n=1 Tax=Saccharomonospora piscinae TaxID=687388 RepID=UPI00055B6A7E|nr:DUF559 domain-containing protein [Saccharomonospora piscinae]
MRQNWGVRGALRRRDAAAVLGEHGLRVALRSGALTQPWRGVVVPSVEWGELRTRVSAAVLFVGRPVVVSGPTALALYGCDAVSEVGPVHVTVPYSRSARPRPGLVMHQNRFDPADVVELEGLPVFPLEDALAEYLCGRDTRRAFGCLDQALAQLSGQAREALRDAVRERLTLRDDPRGVGRARMLADLATGRAESPPESSLLLLVVEAGLPVPTAQYPVHTIDGRLLYVLDLAWEHWRIALEYDGYAAHEQRGERDAERDRRLASRGWLTIRATTEDLRDPARLLAELREAFAERSR